MGATHGVTVRTAAPSLVPMMVRAWLRWFVPLAFVWTATSGMTYTVAQQVWRIGANDPQVQLAGDAARRLASGATPSSVVGSEQVAVGSDLGPFVVVYDPEGKVLASDATLDGGPPSIPAGVRAAAASTGIDQVTWEPRPGLRFATVTIGWSGGTVMAGRSLRIVEGRIADLGRVLA
ncbi:MAG TPA: hypothetical protein VET90_02125, partial [Candidatus Binatus sp.]|nr:hypothetical protein [Candidatus Binatus sp.]